MRRIAPVERSGSSAILHFKLVYKILAGCNAVPVAAFKGNREIASFKTILSSISLKEDRLYRCGIGGAKYVGIRSIQVKYIQRYYFPGSSGCIGPGVC